MKGKSHLLPGDCHIEQEALLSQCRAMLRVCIASIQNVERMQSFIISNVVSASDIPLRTIKFFSVLFSSAYLSMLRAVTNTR